MINIEIISFNLWVFLVIWKKIEYCLQICCNKCYIECAGIGAYFGAMCEKHGMLIRVAGDNIMMSPPFIISPEEVDEVHLTPYRFLYPPILQEILPSIWVMTKPNWWKVMKIETVTWEKWAKLIWSKFVVFGINMKLDYHDPKNCIIFSL